MYSIDDGHANQIATGISGPKCYARAEAQERANRRGEIVYLYLTDSAAGAEAVEPETFDPDAL